MNLTVDKLSKKHHCLQIKDGKEVIATSVCFDPKDGPGAVLDRLNQANDHFGGEVIGAEEFGFRIFDVLGTLVESKDISIYRNLTKRKLLTVMDIIKNNSFSLKK